MEKEELRRKLKPLYRNAEPLDLSQLLAGEEIFRRAETVALYYPVGKEVSLKGLFAASDKRLVLPRCEGEEPVFRACTGVFSPDRYGVPSPEGEIVPIGQIDLIAVPALCFDKRGFRLGHGGGWYDRALAGFSGIAVGVIREEFLFDRIPTDRYDRAVDRILTEKGVSKIERDLEKRK